MTVRARYRPGQPGEFRPVRAEGCWLGEPLLRRTPPWQRHRFNVGEAKRGPELFNEHTQEQLRDFSRSFTSQGRRSHFILCVPRAYRDEAREAIIAAGGNIKNVTIVSPAPVRGRRNQVARAAPYQRGRVTPAVAPGTPLQRGRKRAVNADVLAAAQRAALRKLRSG